jgi:hypothetical protein
LILNKLNLKVADPRFEPQKTSTIVLVRSFESSMVAQPVPVHVKKTLPV